VGYANAWIDAIAQEERAAAAVPDVERRASEAVVERRWRAVKKYRDDHELDAVGFARHVGISDTAVKGIVREDWKRFDRETQGRLLRAIGITREDWYRERFCIQQPCRLILMHCSIA